MIDFDNSEFLDALQTECLQVQDNKLYSDKMKAVILNIGAEIFVLECHKEKFGTIKKFKVCK